MIFNLFRDFILKNILRLKYSANHRFSDVFRLRKYILELQNKPLILRLFAFSPTI